MLSQLPTLGVGLGFRPPFRGELLRHQQQIDFLEIIADHYFDAPPEKEQELQWLAEHFTLVPHAINLSVGSAEGLDRAYLHKLANLIEQIKPPWWSEHIALTRAGGVDIGHLSPLPFTHEAADVIGRNIAQARRWIDVPLILENIAYTLTVPGGEMSEVEFLTEVVEGADCGWLLDVTNLYTNSVNFGYDPRAFLERAPLQRVVQLHFVGGHWDDGVLIDSHSGPTPPEVWPLMDAVLAGAPVKGIILERDDNIPPLEALIPELAEARSIGERRGRWK